MSKEDPSSTILEILNVEVYLSRGNLYRNLLERGITKDDADNAVNMLLAENRIKIREYEGLNGIRRFFLSIREAWFLAVFAITTLNIISWILIPEDRVELSWIRFIIGTLFIFIVPGVCLLFLMRLDRTLDSLENLILIVVLSIAIEPMIGILLNFTPWGVDPVALVISLSIFSYLLSGIALISRWRSYGRFETAIVSLNNK